MIYVSYPVLYMSYILIEEICLAAAFDLLLGLLLIILFIIWLYFALCPLDEFLLLLGANFASKICLNNEKKNRKKEK